MIGTEWCGKHKTTQMRYNLTQTSSVSAVAGGGGSSGGTDKSRHDAALHISRAWRRWISRRSGPLLWFREMSNNPYDFFSGDPVTDLPLKDIISFVDGGKGYIMDIKSAVSLLEHAETSGETPLNPFNREPLSPLFLRRVRIHTKRAGGWTSIKPLTEEQKLTLAVTDAFRAIEDLGYYTDPSWFLNMSGIQLQQVYMELADIWYHRAALTTHDRRRIVPPPTQAFPMSVQGALVMQQKGLRLLLLKTINALVTSATERSDRQTGVMYVLGALSVVSDGCAMAYPWLREMFSPGCTRIIGTRITVLHPSVLTY